MVVSTLDALATRVVPELGLAAWESDTQPAV